MSLTPRISVVVPTFNRAQLLEAALRSLEGQTLARDEFEVVVVDDGSTDGTGELVQSRDWSLQLKYFRQPNSGSAVAKNLGLFASRAPLCLFFDDDDVAGPEMLQEHVKGHASHPEEATSILGFTTWSSDLVVTPVMNYLTDVGQALFHYGELEKGQELDFRYFWTGRISCKRSYLASVGVFSTKMPRVEDIELGFRLAKWGHSIRFWPDARSFMNRAVTFDDFCARAEKDGRALAVLRTLHPEAEIQHYCLGNLLEQVSWREDGIADIVNAARSLEKLIGPVLQEHDRQLLPAFWELCRRAFIAHSLKGLRDASG